MHRNLEEEKFFATFAAETNITNDNITNDIIIISINT